MALLDAGSLIEEWKKAKTPEKVMVVGGVVGAVAIMLYLHNQSQQANATQPFQANTGAGQLGPNGYSGPGYGTAGNTMGGGIQTVPTASGGSVPIIPAGLQPQFDQLGNLIDFAPVTPTAPTPRPSPTPSPSHTPAPTPRPAPAPSGNPIIPLGQYRGPSYSNLRPNTTYTYQGTKYTLKAGAGGRLWGINPSGQQVLLYGTPSQYKSVAGGGYPLPMTPATSTRTGSYGHTPQARAAQRTSATRVYASRRQGVSNYQVNYPGPSTPMGQSPVRRGTPAMQNYDRRQRNVGHGVPNMSGYNRLVTSLGLPGNQH